MPIKHTDFIIKGMHRDLSESVFNPEFAYENYNIRITTDKNSNSLHTGDLLALTNERGNKYTPIIGLNQDMEGIPIGQCKLNDYWVVFYKNDNSDNIYKLWHEEDGLHGELLYNGNLNFDYNYPIESFGFYENEQIQKVYWTDGINQPRFINIAENDEIKALWNDKSFDFVPEINLLNHNIVINERQTGGRFPAGVIQWCFTYSRRFGQETSIFETTPLYEIKFPDRGAAPDEQTPQSFEIVLTGADTNFDFVNIYSIIRTSLDNVPIVKCIANLPIVDGTIRFVDTNLYGYAVDPQELLYKGGEIISAYTMEHKDNTLFLGNYSLKRSFITQDIRDEVKALSSQLGYFKNNDFSTPHFMKGNIYRFAVQFQHKSGKWSEAVYLRDKYCDTRYSYAKLDFSDNAVKQKLIDLGYVRVRPLVIYPNINERGVIAQGVLSNTMSMTSDRNKLYPDYFFRFLWNGDWGGVANDDMNSTWRYWYDKFCWVPLGDMYDPMRNEYSSYYIPSSDINTPAPNRNWWSFYSPDVNFNDSYQIDWNDIQVDMVGFISMLTPVIQTNKIETSSISKPTEGKRQWWRDDDNVPSRTPYFYNYVDSGTVQDEPIKAYDDKVTYTDGTNTWKETLTKTRFKVYGENRPWDFVYSTSDNTEYFDSTALYPKRIPSSFSIKPKANRHYVGGFLWEDTFMNISREHIETLNKDVPTRAGGFMQYYGQWIYPVMLWQASGSINYDTDKDPSSVLKSNKTLNYFKASVEDLSTSKTISLLTSCKSANSINVLKLEDSEIDPILYSNRVDDIILWNENYSALFYLYPTASKIKYDYSFKWNSIRDDAQYVYNRQYPNWHGNTGYIESIAETLPYDDKKRRVLGTSNADSDFAWHNLGDIHYRSRSAEMKYTTIPNYVINIDKDDIRSIWSSATGNVIGIPIVSLHKYIQSSTLFGGSTESVLQNNNFLVAGKAVNISDSNGTPIDNVEIWWSVGDTYYQDYEILKTYPLSFEAENCVTEILRVKLETYWNMDCRYDTWENTPTFATSPANWNLMNPIYNQKDNFFVYHGLDLSTNSINNYPNSFTWTKTKWAGDLTDKWTHITLASTMDVDGNKGEITKLIKLQDNLLCFQPRGLSQILYNEREQISTGSGVPIELANSGKVSGIRYITEQTGCNNKWSICKTESGLYWIDDENKAIMAWNQQLANLSDTLGFHSWINEMSELKVWNPVDFNSFVTYYDPYNCNMMFFFKEKMLSYNTQLNCFDSFFSYGSVPYYMAIDGTSFTLSNKDTFGKGTYKVWEQHKGDYNYFYVQDECEYNEYGEIITKGKYDNGQPTEFGYEPYFTTILVNPDMPYDKVFTNLDMRTDMWNKDKELLEETFSHLEVWNEFQWNKSTLIRNVDIPKVHLPAQHSILKKKFGVWYVDIPRDIKNPDKRYYKRDRMRNTWLYVKLSKELIDNDDMVTYPYISNNKHIIHHIGVSYFI